MHAVLTFACNSAPDAAAWGSMVAEQKRHFVTSLEIICPQLGHGKMPALADNIDALITGNPLILIC
jgi:hypothetical protein